MTSRDELIALAREAGNVTDFIPYLERFYQLAVAEEREKAERKLAVAREALKSVIANSDTLLLSNPPQSAAKRIAHEALAQIGEK